MPKYVFVLPVMRQLSLTFPPRRIALAPHSTAKRSASLTNTAEGVVDFPTCEFPVSWILWDTERIFRCCEQEVQVSAQK